jgi:hypothetical protein
MGRWVEASEQARTNAEATPLLLLIYPTYLLIHGLNMQERRRHIRIETPVLVEFPNPETMKTERSFTQDVSETGMRFPTTVKLQLGQEIPLTLELPFQNSTMHATGEILWVRQVSRLGDPQYEVGVRFCWIEDPDRQRLTRHLASLFRGRA